MGLYCRVYFAKGDFCQARVGLANGLDCFSDVVLARNEIGHETLQPHYDQIEIGFYLIRSGVNIVRLIAVHKHRQRGWKSPC